MPSVASDAAGMANPGRALQARRRAAGKKTDGLAKSSRLSSLPLSIEYIYRLLYYIGIRTIRTGRRLIRRTLHITRHHGVRIREGHSKKLLVYKKQIARTIWSGLSPIVEAKNEIANFAVKLRGGSAAKSKLMESAKFYALSAVWMFRCIFRLLFGAANYILPVVGIYILMSTINYFDGLNYALSVEYGGNHIGYIKDESVFEAAERAVKGRIINEDYESPVDAIPRFSLAVVPEESLTLTDTLTDRIISESGNQIHEATGLYIDNQFVGATTDGDDLLRTLSDMLDAHRDSSAIDERVEFVKNIQVTNGLFPVSSIVELNDIKDTLNSEVEGERLYTVQSGDAPSLIAQKNDIKYADLKALNPDIEKSLLVGQEVIISKSVQFLGVKKISKVSYEESIPYTTVKIPDPQYVTSFSKVKKDGKEGVKEVVAEITYIDGVETERTILSETVIKEPVARELIVGSAKPLSQKTSAEKTSFNGSFIWPSDGGYMSCAFLGYRGHTGMDIAASYGTNIRAAAPGTVVLAKYVAGGYGRYIIIDHGGGVQTLYAHNSANYVKVGDKVAQGQIIAAMGRTGNVTGTHVHFEIRINGRYMNPANYIGKSYKR